MTYALQVPSVSERSLPLSPLGTCTISIVPKPVSTCAVTVTGLECPMSTGGPQTYFPTLSEQALSCSTSSDYEHKQICL